MKNKDITLVIMAAGMGSRFGGLKQIEPIGPNGEFLIDYSIYDAKRAGFNKVVIIIKKENYEVFKETIGKRIEPHIKVEYAFQEMDKIPEGVEVPEDRIKPFGTAHALYCAKDNINGPFAVISADDFYGHESFDILADSIINKEEYSIIGYKVGNTITDNGSVKRGVIFVDENNKLLSIKESKVEKIDGEIVCEPLNGDETFTVEEDHPVSMLMYGLQKDVIDYLEKDIDRFFEDNKDDLEKCEYLLPDVLDDFMKANGVDMNVISTPATWYGVTYKEDKDVVQNAINKLIEEGIYPSELWPKNN